MDPFTQRMLEKAEKRSKALGISNAVASQFPLRSEECFTNSDVLSGACSKTMAVASQQNIQKLQLANASGEEKIKHFQVVEKNNADKNDRESAPKVLRQFSAVDKENMDLGIEISILTDKNVEVKVQVEEDNENECEVKENNANRQIFDRPTAKIRDTSRNRLQRLGALYSNKDDLSSPIHRTEGQFHAEETEAKLETQQRLPQQRLGKLAALANTINQWEDDISHRIVKGSSKSEIQSPTSDLPKQSKEHNLKLKKGTVKHLKWDSDVLNSLTAQGFQRRESSTVKVSYDFENTNKEGENLRTVGQIFENIEGTVAEKLKPVKSFLPNKTKPSEVQKEPQIVKSGLVSGRAAIFENQINKKQSQQQKFQKDPTELSLKERMELFEKNKGEALIPKAAFGMAPPIKKILQESCRSKDSKTTASENARMDMMNSCNPSVSTPLKKAVVESKVREKVNALLSAASENKIKEDIKKQREEDLQLLANRYNKQRNISTENQSRIPLPPPPPPPKTQVDVANISSKRRSPGDVFDDDNKRPRKANNGMPQRLYPALSDFESSESHESESDNCCTTATVSASSTSNKIGNSALPLKKYNNSKDNHESDEENDDSYVESDNENSSANISNASLGREIMRVVKKNDKNIGNKVKVVTYAEKDHFIADHNVNTSNNSSDLSMGVDDYLEEAFEENVYNGDVDCSQSTQEETSHISMDSKGTTASNSFSFHKSNTSVLTGYKIIGEENNKIQQKAYETKDNLNSVLSSSNMTSPLKSEFSVHKENENVVTLVHTVSFYRRQQSANSANSTPIRTISREKQVLRSAINEIDAQESSASMVHHQTNSDDTDEYTQSESETDDTSVIQDKIKKLLDEVCKQQQVIAQTSQALNLCAATIEFSGSTESVEGERHLLVATHRRQACLDEVQRLRVEKTLRPVGAPNEKGRLIVKEITIPLRQDYIRKLSSDSISGHHLVCLLKYNEHVLATKTVPTLPGLLAVKFPDMLQLNNVYADFRITLEIYGMTAQREVLPHEVKYHINFNKKSGIKTPKKKGSDNRLVMPPVQSPAGPHAVRTPALVQYGFAIFSLREIQRTTWSLTQVLGVSPLEGTVHMKVNCELSVTVEHKGFLTMFEDISGLGAWHRRWCYLNGTVLNYWKYPDDEKKKAPMGIIDLYTCSSKKVNLAPRDICARLNTMLLECQRPFKDTDKESLIIVPCGRTTTVRYLLSADTKEEREEWCAYFNKTLTLLRAWGPPQ